MVQVAEAPAPSRLGAQMKDFKVADSSLIEVDDHIVPMLAVTVAN
jgi:hypothetical protein